jgi:hypothetical protein
MFTGANFSLQQAGSCATRQGCAMSPKPYHFVLCRRESASSFGYDDYEVLCKGREVGRVFYTAIAPHQRTWMWTITACIPGATINNGYGYEPNRDAALRAFEAAWDQWDLTDLYASYANWLEEVRST